MPKPHLRQIFYDCCLIRAAEEAIVKHYFSDEIKTPVHLSIGAEAISSVVVNTLGSENYYYGTYRSHALYLALTRDLHAFFGELHGKESGASQGKAGSMHLLAPEKNLMATSAIVGSTAPLAVGGALAEKLKGSSKKTVCFHGDGAMEEGAFFEAMNFACVKKLNVLFVCEDNALAIHAHKKGRQSFTNYQALIESFGARYMMADQRNIQDFVAVCEEIKTINAPVFLHCPHHRFMEHVGVSEDYQAGYRDRPSDLPGLDPLNAFDELIEKDEREKIKKEVDDLVERAFKSAQAAAFSDIKIAGENIT